MALIRGSCGLIYFVHEWEPKFRESALFDDPDMLAGVTELNREIARWAPLLNTPSLDGLATVRSTGADEDMALMVKQGKDGTYLFAMETGGKPATAQFELLRGLRSGVSIRALEDGREWPLKVNRFEETFEAWQVRIYRVTPALQ